MLTEAVKTSYASAARVLGEDSAISKTAVMDKVHGIQTEQPFPKPKKKKCVEYLYIEAAAIFCDSPTDSKFTRSKITQKLDL